jgi:anti-sigma factor RsiW
MTWTCDQVEARLSDYLEGMLTEPERAEFEAHVHECAECAKLVEGVASLVSEMRSLEAVDVPPRLVFGILDQTLGPQEKVSAWQGLRNLLRGLGTPKFAYGAASVLATVFILANASGLSWRKPKLADLNPATMSRKMNQQVHLGYAHVVKYVSDLRVVYEIQSRLRQDQEQLQVAPEETAPKTQPESKPGKGDDQTHTQPRQQNRAVELARQVELLASECPLVLERSNR